MVWFWNPQCMNDQNHQVHIRLLGLKICFLMKLILEVEKVTWFYVNMSNVIFMKLR